MKRLVWIVLVMLMACKNETKEVTPTLEDVKTEVKQTSKQLLDSLKSEGFETFDYVDEKTKDTIIMQQYFIAFLKTGPIRNQNEEEATILQKQHRAHLGKMYDLGYADISGPFGDDGDIRGITIYNVPTLKMADSLANSDPMVKAGRLKIEVHPWWAAKGYSLR
ncbi:hypothetical protein [Olleya sp. YS]|uniref:YciI family protein n=1 Tax=Olleya sp. YS TaxID=3028318 RepID=UPI00243451B5|nr:hypothetical protein [Olleya sp. YS]WGD35926.1 hypothetical protein Ollyesu_05805 [Olleya sp. YS]